MLEAAEEESKPTEIMYKAYMSYIQLKEYLVLLIESGLIEHIPTEQKYRTTEKGLKFLSTMNQLIELSHSKVLQEDENCEIIRE